MYDTYGHVFIELYGFSGIDIDKTVSVITNVGASVHKCTPGRLKRIIVYRCLVPVSIVPERSDPDGLSSQPIWQDGTGIKYRVVVVKYPGLSLHISYDYYDKNNG